MKSIEVEGKTVDQAIEIGLYKLEAKREDVKIAILKEASLFDKAKVRLTIASNSEEENNVEETVKNVITAMGLTADVYVEERETEFFIDVTGEDAALLIGKRGDTLDALQFILSQILNKGKGHEEYKKVILDSAGYKTKREATLKGLAHRIAGKAVRENRNIALEPMNAFERRIIHAELAESEKVETESRGNEPNRYVVIKVKNPRNKKKETAVQPELDLPRDDQE